MNSKNAPLVLLLLCMHLNAYSQSDFNDFINQIEEEHTIHLNEAKKYLQVAGIEEPTALNELQLDTLVKYKAFYGLSFSFTNQNECEIGYFVSLNQNGSMIDQVAHTRICEIDLEKTSFSRSEGEIIDGFIKILREEEAVIHPTDSTDNLNNSETELMIYNQYYEIDKEGYFTSLSSPKQVHMEREFGFASQELLQTEDLKAYKQNELRLIRSEILASYGHVFTDKRLQKRYEDTSWYSAQGDGYPLLTDVEKRNIQVIDALLIK